jgi:hypothetical protein
VKRRDFLHYLAYTGVGVANIGAVAAFFSSCAKRQIERLPVQKDKYGVTLLVDGWRADLFREMLDSGSLPNIQKHLVDRGTMVDTCVSTFPSTTGPAHLPFITGVMPGHNNCPGLRWIDRSNRSLRDYCTMHNVLFNYDFPERNYTLYEYLAGERTSCIFDFVSRGASDIITVPAKALWFVLSGDMDIWNRMDGHAAEAFQKAYLGGGTLPRYSFVWMPAIDHLAHFHGSADTIIQDRALAIDNLIGSMMETLHKAGIYDQTLFSLVADHGLSDTERHVDLRKILQSHGFHVLEDLLNNDQFNSLRQNNAARGVSGNAFALLYFAAVKKGRLGMMSYDWDRAMSYDELRDFPVSESERVDIIRFLREEEGVRMLMVKEKPDDYLVFSQNGEGRIERDNASFRYSVTGVDPFGYTDHPDSAVLIDGRHHDKDEWFTATRNTEFPDGIFQSTQLFDSPRCGDIVITAQPGWDLMDQKHIASHGSFEKTQLQVPCVIAGPGVKQGTIPIARTVDLHPTYLKHFALTQNEEDVLDVFI